MKYTIPKILVDQIKLVEIPEFSKKKVSRMYLNMILSMTPAEDVTNEDNWTTDFSTSNAGNESESYAARSDEDIGLEEINLCKDVYISLNKNGDVIGYVVKETADDLKYGKEKECTGFTFHDQIEEALNQYKSDAYFSIIRALKNYHTHNQQFGR